MRFTFLLLLVVLLGGALFATQDANMEPVGLAIPYTDLQLTGPLLIVVIGTLFAGYALGYLAALPGRFGAARRARRAEKRLGEAETARGATANAEARAAEARAEAAGAQRDAAAARASSYDAAETQRLADEVARRTAGTQRDVPPPPPAR